MKVVWSRLAHQQLDEAMAYIAADRPATAVRWLEHLLESAGNLADFPDQGRVVDEVRRDDVRELIVPPYRIVYRRDPDVVYIALVLHDRRHLDAEDVD